MKFDEKAAERGYLEGFNGRDKWPGVDTESFIAGARWQFEKDKPELENLQALFDFADTHIAKMYEIEWKEIKRKCGK